MDNRIIHAHMYTEKVIHLSNKMYFICCSNIRHRIKGTDRSLPFPPRLCYAPSTANIIQAVAALKTRTSSYLIPDTNLRALTVDCYLSSLQQEEAIQ